MQMNVGPFRLLIRTVKSGEVFDLATAGLFVQAFRVALLTNFQRCIDKDLHKFIILDHIADHASLCPEG